jgi:hypothetical protein
MAVKMKRIIVCGTREWDDAEVMKWVMRGLRKQASLSVTLVHGAARGADRMAGAYAARYGWDEEPWPALWDRFGKRAGFIRNQYMADAGADLCIGFLRRDQKNAGTQDMMARARKAGIKVVEVWV